VDEPEPAEDNHTAKNQQARWDLQNPTSIAEQNEGETRELLRRRERKRGTLKTGRGGS
jgi:hypothetical protein